MTALLFSQFEAAIRAVDLKTLKAKRTIPLPTSLRLYPEGSDIDPDGLAAFYTPFDRVNPNAKLVLLGTTPGRAQFVNAIEAAQKALCLGSDVGGALEIAKRDGAFEDGKKDKPGVMRWNIARMLNDWGVHRYLHLDDAKEVFGSAWNLVHTTSVLPHAVLRKGGNYEGKDPHLLERDWLRQQVLNYLVPQLLLIPDALILPLGVVAGEVMDWLISQGVIDPSKVATGLAHPSNRCTTMIDWLLGQRDGPVPRGTPVRRYRHGREEFRRRFLLDASVNAYAK